MTSKEDTRVDVDHDSHPPGRDMDGGVVVSRWLGTIVSGHRRTITEPFSNCTPLDFIGTLFVPAAARFHRKRADHDDALRSAANAKAGQKEICHV